MRLLTAAYESPIGWIEITGTDEGLATLFFVERLPDAAPEKPGVLEPVVRELDEYFLGRRRDFTVRVRLEGTPFQRSVWSELRKIPFGQTVSYGDLARSLGKPGAARAVGLANHANPVSIIVPCHRVVGHDGDLVGYGGGLWRKRWLLDHEGFQHGPTRSGVRAVPPGRPQGGKR